jgi:hypothetical protein
MGATPPYPLPPPPPYGYPPYSYPPPLAGGSTGGHAPPTYSYPPPAHDSMMRQHQKKLAANNFPPVPSFFPINLWPDVSQCWEYKIAKETLSLVFSPPYTSFRFCTNFITARCHDIAGQYPNTQGLKGLRSIDQNFGSGMVERCVCLSFQKRSKGPQ